LVLGMPGKIIRPVTDAEIKMILSSVKEYLHLSEQLPMVTG
jgi:hypothetical protein